MYEGFRRRLLRVARRASLCPEDARDALQRGFEIALHRAPVEPGTELLPWLTTVVRNEALLIRRRRLRCLSTPGRPNHGLPTAPGEECDPELRAFEREWARERLADLAALPPDQSRALALCAHGYSYAEIAALTGWTYTKVNRCITEGRARLRRR